MPRSASRRHSGGWTWSKKQRRRGGRKPKIAVLLNNNARKVNACVVGKIKEQVPHADIFLTHTLEEAESALKKVARGRYDLCFTGGGDGTVCHAVTRLSELSAGRQPPPIGVLPLGTGNAIASYLESPEVLECVRRPHRAQKDTLAFPEMKIAQSRLSETKACKAAFGGFGWDSYVLDRYFRWRNVCKRFSFLRPISEGLPAYLLSGLGWAVPSLLLKRPRRDVIVRNGSQEAYQLDSEGQIVKRFAPYEIIYQGKTRLFSFGTCPFFGFRLKALPFAAAHPDMMHIRLADFSPLITVAALPKIWRGTFKHSRLWDFISSEFSVELDAKTALQMGGDIVGHSDHFEVKMSTPAQVLRFGKYEGLKLTDERQAA